MDVGAFISNGVVIIDKPCGQTSHEITSFVKNITGSPRSGHAGTLDPNVSGVLPVALGRATKLLQYIAGKDKTYVGIIKFKVPQSEERIEELFSQFTGEIFQNGDLITGVLIVNCCNECTAASHSITFWNA